MTCIINYYQIWSDSFVILVENIFFSEIDSN